MCYNLLICEGEINMTFRKKLYYIALTEYLLNKNNNIAIDKDLSLSISTRRGTFRNQLDYLMDIPTLDFRVSILKEGEVIYSTFYQKIYEELDTLLKSNPEHIKAFINRKDYLGNEYSTYSYYDFELEQKVRIINAAAGIESETLSFKNPKVLVRKNVSNKYNEIKQIRTK